MDPKQTVQELVDRIASIRQDRGELLAEVKALQEEKASLINARRPLAKGVPSVNLRKDMGADARVAAFDDQLAKVEELINQIEYRQQTSSTSRAEDREFVAEINRLKASKDDIRENKELERRLISVQAELKTKKQALDRSLGHLDTLRDFLSKAEVASQIYDARGTKIEPKNVLKKELPVDKEEIGRIIGRGGSQAKKIEEEAGVRLRSDDDKITIFGDAEGIARAEEIIAGLQSLGEETVDVSPEIAAALIADKGARVQQIQQETDVRLSVSRGDETVRMFGPKNRLSAVKAALAVLEKTKKVVKVPGNIVAGVIGSGGENIKNVQQETGAFIALGDRDRSDRSNPVDFTILGKQEQTARAVTMLNDLIRENEEHDLPMPVPDRFIPFLLVNKGSKIREFQTAHRVFLQLGKQSDETANTVTIRGTRSALASAVPAFEDLKKEFERLNREVEVSTAQGRALLRNQGELINKLREQHPEARIDLRLSGEDAGVVYVGADDEATLAAAQQGLSEVLAQYVENSFEITDEACKALIGKGGENIAKLQKETNTSINVSNDKGATRRVQVSGLEEGVQQAVEQIKEIAAKNHVEIVDLPTREVLGTLFGTGGKAIQTLEEETETKIDVVKQKMFIRCIGRKENVEDAAKRIRDVFEK